jgi:acetaldehyde dehydrogenase (acetylating)
MGENSHPNVDRESSGFARTKQVGVNALQSVVINLMTKDDASDVAVLYHSAGTKRCTHMTFWLYSEVVTMSPRPCMLTTDLVNSDPCGC